jgi:hypothetical protein
MGVNNVARMAAIRLDGQTVVDWMQYPTGGLFSTVITTWYLGPASTGTNTFTCHVDDVAVDYERWCEPGKVVALWPESVKSGTGANWTLNTGTDKAVALASVDGDTSYIYNNATTGYGDTAGSIRFNMTDLPSDVTQVYGHYMVLRWRRAAAGAPDVRWHRSIGSLTEEPGLNSMAPASSAAYEWSGGGVGSGTNSWNPYGWGLDPDTIHSICYGFANASSTQVAYISAMLVEVDCSTDISERAHTRRLYLASCDTGDLSEFDSSSATAPATLAASSAVVRTGTYSVKFNATTTAGAAVGINPTSSNNSAPPYQMFGRIYMYTVRLPNTGQHFRFINNGPSSINDSWGLSIRGDGSIGHSYSNITPATWSSAGAITTNVWQRVEWRIKAASASATADAQITIWVDDVEVLAPTTVTGDKNVMNQSFSIGIFYSTSTTGAEYYCDDIAFDHAARIKESKVIDLRPTTIGTHPGTNWSYTGATDFVDAVDEVTPDGDTSYISGAPTSGGTGVAGATISFGMDNLPSVATVVHAVRTSHRRRSDNGNTTQYTMGTMQKAMLPSTTSYTVGTTATYTWQRQFHQVSQFARWTPTLFNETEIYFRNTATTGAPRISTIMTTVEYVETNEGYLEVSGDGLVEAGTTRTLEVSAGAMVVETRILDISANAVLSAPDSTRDIAGGGFVLDPIQTRSVNANAHVTGLKTKDIAANAIVKNATGPISSARYVVTQGDAWVSDGTVYVTASADAVVSEPEINVLLPSRLYFTNALPAYDVARKDGDWDDTLTVITRRLASFKSGTLTSMARTDTTTGDSSHLFVSFLSDPLLAQTIQGSMTLTMPVMESNSNMDARYRIHMWVAIADTDLVRGVVLSNHTDLATPEFTTSATARSISANMNTVAVQDGDRLVVEVGVFTNGNDNRIATLSYGGRTALGVDHPDATDGGTATSAGWIDISLPFIGTDPTIQEIQHEVSANGYVVGQSTLEVSADAIVYGGVTTQTKDISADGNLSDTIRTKLYLSTASPLWTGAVTDYKGTWGNPNFAKIWGTEDPTQITASLSRTGAETSASPTSLGILMLVSPALNGAQTVGGMLDLVIGAMESNAAANMSLRVHAWVTNGTASTARGTLVSNWTETLEVTTTARGTQFVGQVPLTSVAAQSGDFIVMEIGLYTDNLSTTSYTGRLYYGSTSNSVELTSGSSNVTSSLGYAGFTQDLVFTYPNKYREISGSGILRVETNRDLTANGFVIGPNSTAEISASATVRAPDSQLEIFGSAIVRGEQTLAISASAMVETSLGIETSADAIVQAETFVVLETGAIVLAETFIEANADSILQAEMLLETESTGLVQITNELDLEGAGILQAEYELLIQTDTIVLVTTTTDVSTDALVEDIVAIELGADAYVVFVVDLEVASAAIVRSETTTEIAASMAPLKGLEGTIRGRPLTNRMLTGDPLVGEVVDGEQTIISRSPGSQASTEEHDDLHAESDRFGRNHETGRLYGPGPRWHPGARA